MAGVDMVSNIFEEFWPVEVLSDGLEDAKGASVTKLFMGLQENLKSKVWIENDFDRRARTTSFEELIVVNEELKGSFDESFTSRKGGEMREFHGSKEMSDLMKDLILRDIHGQHR